MTANMVAETRLVYDQQKCLKVVGSCHALIDKSALNYFVLSLRIIILT
jgi:hypothetical protein